ncbi:hypothetical protein [Sphingobacterium lumbrici]|uniref:hypothetical protein n=1 Tax=Sphingobacterium lumbrici TaxID=2559600 RepID=UPI00112AE8B2|nr:hypothetical protein [Sphingobacterium lumbrici]
MNYEKYYDLETFLFTDVHNAFHENEKLSADQFFCIVIWKANRAKSKIAKRLLADFKMNSDDNLDHIVDVMTSKIHEASSSKDKLSVLIEEYKFRLPMASAILSVLYPDDFSVYDIRICEILQGDFPKIADRTFERLWEGYMLYLEKVKEISSKTNYRDADKYLWGKSFYDQLVLDIQNNFKSSKD